MVIMHDVEKNIGNDVSAIEQYASPYVYLVDNEQKMMLILKNDLSEVSKITCTGQPSLMQDYIVEKVQTLLNRVNDNGPLSSREMEILKYAAMGKSNKQIAEIIGISESTVKNHFSSTLRKLKANDRTHAVILAVCNGWLNVKILTNLIINKDSNSATEKFG